MTGRRPWLIASLVIVLISCEDDGVSIGDGFSSSESPYGIAFTDTTTILTSTVLLDSLPTSGTGTLLIGKYQDEKLGTVESTAYIQLGNTSSWSVDERAVFDSVVLVLPYSGFWYGDTTKVSQFQVHEVSEDFTTYTLPLYWLDEGLYPYFNNGTSLYNTSSTPYNNNSALTSFSVRPRPNSTDTINARLPDSLGKYWLEEGMKETNIFSSTSEFQNNFKGIAIKYNSTDPSSIFGILGSDVKIRIYYREYKDEVLQQTYYDLTYNSAYYQYNKITGDRDNTVLENLNQNNKVISSVATADESYIQSGVGIVTKIEFPHIRKLLSLEGLLIINDAFLIIEPIPGTIKNNVPLPSTLTLFQTNKTNFPLAPLYVNYGSSEQSATITFDTEYGETSGYTFSITQFVQSIIQDDDNNLDGTALLLSTHLDELRNSVSRACLGSGQHADYRMRLEIYYTYKK